MGFPGYRVLNFSVGAAVVVLNDRSTNQSAGLPVLWDLEHRWYIYRFFKIVLNIVHYFSKYSELVLRIEDCL